MRSLRNDCFFKEGGNTHMQRLNARPLFEPRFMFLERPSPQLLNVKYTYSTI